MADGGAHMYDQFDPYRGCPPLAPASAPDLQRRQRRTAIVAGATSVLAAATVLGLIYATSQPAVVNGIGSSVQADPAMDRQGSGARPPVGSKAPVGSSTTASAAQQIGVVDINTVLKYQQAKAAGTGMVLTSTGEILTNNHVILGATSISVRVVTTGKTYQATVVGTAPTRDVAVLQLTNASGLQTSNLGDSAGVKVGDAVTGVGNAGGDGGMPSAAQGAVIALDQALTASDANGQNPERLTGMIETNAAIQPGDSGGPLFDSANHVIGMDTAASVARRGTAAGFAIPIATATSVADEIEAGRASSTIHLGYPAFLGVSIAANSASRGAQIQSALAGGPAQKAGLGAGDVITSLGGTPIQSGTALRAAITAHKPGQDVAVAWLDTTGQAHHATITLIAGPPD
ncbi:MAG: trypsin-like peptidase domain-containing protein [Pseudonocardiales bacterium]